MKVYLLRRPEREVLKNTDKYSDILSCLKKHKINDRFILGDLESLIEDCKSLEEWRNYYFGSGLEREFKLSNLDSITRKSAINYAYFIENERTPYNAVPGYNYNYGRTRDELGDISLILQEELTKEGKKYSIEDVYATVFDFVIDETWNNK